MLISDILDGISSHLAHGLCGAAKLLLAVPLFVAGIFVTLPTASQAPGGNSVSEKPKEAQCRIAGSVIKLEDSGAVKRATVQLESVADRSKSISAVTDPAGRFQLNGIDPGRYKLRVIRKGFVTLEYGQTKPDGPGSILTLRPGQKVSDLLFRLVPSAVIAGRILDEDGEPVPWAQVTALRKVYEAGKRTLVPETLVASNDLGEYRLFGLRPGHYFVCASYNPNEHLTGSGGMIQAGDNSSPEQGYIQTYYPGTLDPGRAVALRVMAGEEIRSVEILLRPETVFRIRGRVVNAVSKGSNSGVALELDLRNAGLTWNAPLLEQPVEKPDGTFEIKNVPPGSYTLVGTWFDGGRMHQARQHLELENSDSEGVTLMILPGMDINGHVTWEGRPNVEAGEISVGLIDVDTMRMWTAPARVSANGFVLRDIAEGLYRIAVSGLCRDCFVKSIRYGEAEYLEDDFTVTRGAQTSLEITISSRGARVQGSVTDADALPGAGVWIVLVPEASHRGLSRLYKTQTTDQYGHFDLRGIAPGDYRLFSWEDVESGSWEDPEFLKPFEDKGERISFREGDQKTQNLTAIRTKRPEPANP